MCNVAKRIDEGLHPYVDNEKGKFMCKSSKT